MKIPVSGLIRDLVQAAILKVKKTEYIKPDAPKPSADIVQAADNIRELRRALKNAESELLRLGWSVHSYDRQTLYNTSSWESKAKTHHEQTQAKRLEKIRNLELALRLQMLGAEAPELKMLLTGFQKSLDAI